MLHLTLFFTYSHKYSFISGKKKKKKWFSNEGFFLFLEGCVYIKNKHLLLPDFSVNRVFD